MMVEIIRPTDRTAWLAARRQDVTASVAGALMGVHPYTTPYGLWAEKTGRISIDDSDSPALRRGRLLEPTAIEMLREDRPDWSIIHDRDNTYFRDGEARLGATPDAFAQRPDIYGQGIVQVKTASDWAFRETWRDPDTEEVVLPLWIAVQAIVEAELTASKWAAVALLVVGRGIDLHVIDVPLHAGVIRRIRSAVADFWAMVDSGERPPIDWMRDGATILDVYRDSTPDRRDLTADVGLDDLVSRYDQARLAVADHKAILDDIKPRLIHALGNAECGETTNWAVSARTIHKAAFQVRPSSTRILHIKPRSNFSGNF